MMRMKNVRGGRRLAAGMMAAAAAGAVLVSLSMHSRPRRLAAARVLGGLAAAMVSVTLVASGSTASADQPRADAVQPAATADGTNSEKLLAELQAATTTAQRVALKEKAATATPSSSAPTGSEARQEAWAEANGIMEMSAQDGVITAALPRTAPTSSLEASKATMRTAGLGGTVVVKRSKLTKAELDATTTKLIDFHDRSASHSVMAFHFDAAQDAVVVSGNLPPAVAERAKGIGNVVLRMDPDARSSRTSEEGAQAGHDRYNDAGPWHYGAASIANQTTSAKCTSGFTMQGPPPDYAPYTVTAGHCGNKGNSFKSGNNWYGTITRKASFPTWDAAMLQCCGDQYGKHIWTSPTSTRSQITSWTPAVGRPAPSGLCVSGATTIWEKCDGNITSTNATFCDSGSCTPGVLEFRKNDGSQMTAIGDSGGPIYSLTSSGEAQIHGMTFANGWINGGWLHYAEKFDTFRNLWGGTLRNW
jgi:hypothetical protein